MGVSSNVKSIHLFYLSTLINFYSIVYYYIIYSDELIFYDCNTTCISCLNLFHINIQCRGSVTKRLSTKRSRFTYICSGQTWIL